MYGGASASALLEILVLLSSLKGARALGVMLLKSRALAGGRLGSRVVVAWALGALLPRSRPLEGILPADDLLRHSFFPSLLSSSGVFLLLLLRMMGGRGGGMSLWLSVRRALASEFFHSRREGPQVWQGPGGRPGAPSMGRKKEGTS